MQDGFDHAMTANSFTSVSLDPALVLVCVEDDSRFHEAITAVGALERERAGGVASAAVPRGSPPAGARSSASSTARRRTAVAVTGALLLDDALVTLDCRHQSDVHRAGDHDIVVGEVLDLRLGAAGRRAAALLRQPVRAPCGEPGAEPERSATAPAGTSVS